MPALINVLIVALAAEPPLIIIDNLAIYASLKYAHLQYYSYNTNCPLVFSCQRAIHLMQKLHMRRCITDRELEFKR